ncbi:hypothetical protein BpHYR1_052129 [Brachionus plicatilis]|uniref:Uncharacterized protein n=1 Tax=Brachionus plicatilis TaxID=10195 RepID=A0A3M7RXE2_BRAPC|nr:hypothetical protein BpHYR1_052129 [Brachionus plicatilis]
MFVNKNYCYDKNSKNSHLRIKRFHLNCHLSYFKYLNIGFIYEISKLNKDIVLYFFGGRSFVNFGPLKITTQNKTSGQSRELFCRKKIIMLLFSLEDRFQTI